MTNQILLGMACEYTRKLEPYSDLSGFDQISAMRAALLWLADNVSDEMVAAWAASNGSARDDIAAALRAAAASTEEK